MREKETCKAESKRSLADPPLPGENPGMVQPPGPIRLEECLFRRLVANETCRFARQRHAVQRVVGRTLFLKLRCPGQRSGGLFEVGKQALRDDGSDRVRHRLLAPGGIDHDAAVWIARRDIEK